MMFSICRATAVAVVAIVIATVASAAPQPTDLGPLADHASDQPISVTIALKLRDPSGAEAMMRGVSTPGDALYGQFLTPEQFHAQFGPTEASVVAVIAHLRDKGLSVERPTARTLKASGTPAVIERIFQTKLHQFQAPAAQKGAGSTFRAGPRHGTKRDRCIGGSRPGRMA